MRWQRAARVLGLVASAPFAVIVFHLAIARPAMSRAEAMAAS